MYVEGVVALCWKCQKLSEAVGVAYIGLCKAFYGLRNLYTVYHKVVQGFERWYEGSIRAWACARSLAEGFDEH